jgi:hypothetical protein
MVKSLQKDPNPKMLGTHKRDSQVCIQQILQRAETQHSKSLSFEFQSANPSHQRAAKNLETG